MRNITQAFKVQSQVVAKGLKQYFYRAYGARCEVRSDGMYYTVVYVGPEIPCWREACEAYSAGRLDGSAGDLISASPPRNSTDEDDVDAAGNPKRPDPFEPE